MNQVDVIKWAKQAMDKVNGRMVTIEFLMVFAAMVWTAAREAKRD